MADEKPLATFDVEKINEAIRAKVRLAFLEAIPEDAWKAMIEKEIKVFIDPKERNYSYNSDRYQPSDFSRVVNEELTKWLRERMLKYLDSDEWRGKWENDPLTGLGHESMSKGVQKIVVEKAGEIVAGILGGAIQSAIIQMRNNRLL